MTLSVTVQTLLRNVVRRQALLSDAFFLRVRGDTSISARASAAIRAYHRAGADKVRRARVAGRVIALLAPRPAARQRQRQGQSKLGGAAAGCSATGTITGTPLHDDGHWGSLKEWALGACLGKGGNGEVFELTVGGGPVLKLMRSSAATQYAREGASDADKIAENTCMVFKKRADFVQSQYVAAPAMLYAVDGGGYAYEMIRLQPMQLSVAVDTAWSSYYAAVEGCVRALHEACIVHGDLKLDNIMLGSDGTGRLVDMDTAMLAEGCALDYVYLTVTPALMHSWMTQLAGPKQTAKDVTAEDVTPGSVKNFMCEGGPPIDLEPLGFSLDDVSATGAAAVMTAQFCDWFALVSSFAWAHASRCAKFINTRQNADLGLRLERSAKAKCVRIVIPAVNLLRTEYNKLLGRIAMLQPHDTSNVLPTTNSRTKNTRRTVKLMQELAPTIVGEAVVAAIDLSLGRNDNGGASHGGGPPSTNLYQRVVWADDIDSYVDTALKTSRRNARNSNTGLVI
jgi:hypothetical protein